MIPEPDLARIRRWVTARNSELSEEVRNQLRLELDVTDRAVTIVDCRPPWNPEKSSEWTRSPVARLRYTKYLREWSLYWCDRNSKFHEYDLVEPSPDVGELIAEIEADPTAIFWG
ncbi:MAG: DUF3024 domain-containing protein [Acidimicrobiia bacterium]